MDMTEPRRGASEEVDRDPTYSPASSEHQQELPDDLPKSLDDRRSVPVFHETEMYDAWQGKYPLPPDPERQWLSRGSCGPSRTCLDLWHTSQHFAHTKTNSESDLTRTIPIPHNPSRRETPEFQSRAGRPHARFRDRLASS
jgi:hypothetical protein